LSSTTQVCERKLTVKIEELRQERVLHLSGCSIAYLHPRDPQSLRIRQLPEVSPAPMSDQALFTKAHKLRYALLQSPASADTTIRFTDIEGIAWTYQALSDEADIDRRVFSLEPTSPTSLERLMINVEPAKYDVDTCSTRDTFDRQILKHLEPVKPPPQQVGLTKRLPDTWLNYHYSVPSLAETSSARSHGRSTMG
jgi:hypothetical protein